MYTHYNYSDSAASGVATGIGILLIIFIALIGVAVVVFELISLAKLFKKAGKTGWYAIIPIYNLIVLFDIIGYKWYYIFMYAVSGIPVVGYLLSILFSLTVNIKLSKSFGKDTGFGIGLWLLGGIFIPIIAFSNDIKYVGKAVNGDIDFNDLF